MRRSGERDGDPGTTGGGGGPAHGQSPYGQSPYGQNQTGPYGRTQQEQGSWAPPYGAPPGPAPVAYPPPAAATGRGNGRPGLIVLFSLLIQLVAVAAVGNTWVVRHATEYRFDHNDTLGAFGFVPSVYAWRFTPRANDTFREFPAMWLALLTLFVVAALLTLALVRGPVTFWRAFVAVWLSVIVATLASGMVRRGVVDDLGRFDSTGGRVVGIFFQGGGVEIVAGALLGLLAGLVAAIVAVASRRRPVAAFAPPLPAPEAEREPDVPPPWYGSGEAAPTGGTSPSMRKVQGSVGDGPPPGSTSRLPDVDPPRDRAADNQATTQFKAVRDENPGADRRPDRTDEPTQATPVVPSAETDQDTTIFRRPEPSDRPADQQRAGSSAPADPQSTQAFPRPPDDEDEGHHPDH